MDITTFLPKNQQKQGREGDMVYIIALRQIELQLKTQPISSLTGKITLEPERLLALAAQNNLVRTGIYILKNSDLIYSEIVFTNLDTLLKTNRPVEKIIQKNSMLKTRKELLKAHQVIYSKEIYDIINKEKQLEPNTEGTPSEIEKKTK